MFHWEGFQPFWGFFYPDGQHILLFTSSTDLYETDISGATPKRLDIISDAQGHVSPDGRSVCIKPKGVWSTYSLQDKSQKSIPGLQPGEFPFAWASDSTHVFITKLRTENGLTISKVDVNSGQRELWQQITPKDPIGLRPMNAPPTITPDGKWVAYTYGNQLGQLYETDALK